MPFIRIALEFSPILFVLIASINFGFFLQGHFKLDNNTPKVALGFFSILGIIQLLSYPLVYFAINTKVIAILYVVIFVCAFFSCLLSKTKLRITKKDYILFAFIIISSAVFINFASNYGVGARSDSIFYISMVNENSVLKTIQTIGFRGNEVESVYYLYQSFYHLFSMLIKVTRNIFSLMNSPIYLYIWGAQILFFYIFFEIIYCFAFKFFKKKYIIFLSFVIASIYLCFIDGFFYLALIGNLWRVLIVSLFFYLFYSYLQCNNYKIFILMGLMLSALVAVSSSGFYISFFIAISIFIVLLKKNLSKKAITVYSLSLISPVIYGAILIAWRYHYSNLLIYGILVIYILICLLLKNLRKFWKQIYTYLFLGLLVFFVIYSLINYKNLYPYNYYFEEHLADMCNQYFVFKNHKQILFNTLWWGLTAYMFYFKLKEKKFTIYDKTFLVLIILFLNPLVMPAVIYFITDFVYYRSYDLIFNIFNLAILFWYLSEKNKMFLKWLVIFQCLLIAVSLHLPFENIALGSIRSSEYNYDRLYKLNQNEKEIVDYLQTEVKNLNYRPWVVSQMPYLKGYVNNIQLKFGISDTREIVKYENEEMLENAPSELLNLFIERDFIGQNIFKEDPNYDKACQIIYEENVEYIILRKDQFKEKDDTWIPIWLDMRACSETLFQNDDYVLLKRY